MATNRYYFSDFIEDSVLRDLAVKAKQTMQYNEYLLQIFRINNETLYGHSPRKALFLMQQNNKSIFLPSSSNENSPSDAKSYEGISTPSRCNPEALYMIRRYLSPDDAEEKEHHPATLEFSTPIGLQKPIIQPTDKAVLNPTIDETSTSNEGFASRISSLDSPEASSQGSPFSSQLDTVIRNLLMDKTEFKSPEKVVGSIDASSQESPRPSVIIQTSPSLAVTEKEFRSQAKEVGNIKLENQESPRSAEITKLTSRLTVGDKVCRNLNRDGWRTEIQIAGNSATNKDASQNPEENAGKSENSDLTNKYFISQAEGINISKPALIASETPSPVKRSRICSIPTFNTHDFGSSSKDNMTENSPEGSKVTVNRIPCDTLSASTNETIKDAAGGDRKRKSLSPIKNTTPFKSMPRVIKLTGEEEIDIEVVDLDYEANPRVPRSNSADYRRDSTKDSSMKSPVHGESKTATSSKTPERHLRPSERVISVGPSHNVPGTISSISDDNVFAGKNPSCSPPIVATATRNLSSEFAHCSADIEDSPTLQKTTILKFNTLLVLRDKAVKNSFTSFQNFQISINFMLPYIDNIIHIINRLDEYGKYSTKKVREIYGYSNALYLKLRHKLKLCKKDVDFDIDTWHKCFLQIEQLRAQYEPLLTDEGEPTVTFEVAQVYECEMRAIWKKMDDMVMLLDSRRASFSHLAPDVVRLIKMLVQSLILVRILQSR